MKIFELLKDEYVVASNDEFNTEFVLIPKREAQWWENSISLEEALIKLKELKKQILISPVSDDNNIILDYFYDNGIALDDIITH